MTHVRFGGRERGGKEAPQRKRTKKEITEPQTLSQNKQQQQPKHQQYQQSLQDQHSANVPPHRQPQLSQSTARLAY
jgi:hypothetical protein